MPTTTAITFLCILTASITFYLLQRVQSLDKKITNVLLLRTQQLGVEDVRRIANIEVRQAKFQRLARRGDEFHIVKPEETESAAPGERGRQEDARVHKQAPHPQEERSTDGDSE